MAAYNKFQQYQENLHKGVHNFTSDATCTLTVALCAAANAPVATNSVLADLTEVAYTNLSSRVITGVTAEHVTGTVHLTATDLTLTASGAVATFRYVVIYDDDPTSPANPLICWFDYGSNVTMANTETFLIDFPTDLFTSV
jgi:hypothetical protein